MPTLPRIPKRAFDDRVVQDGQPCIIVDGLEGWPALGWTPEHLKATFGTNKFRVLVSHTGRYYRDADGVQPDPEREYGITGVPFVTAADWIVNRPAGHTYYVSQLSIGRFPQLLADLRFDRPAQDTQINLWFGSAQTLTALHYDAEHNLFAQVYGSKTITLFAPSETRWLYPHPEMSRMSHLSPIDIDAPDLETYPLFARAARYDFTLQPGEMLFLPAFWWHYVRADTTSISVNQWWNPPLEQFRGANALRFLRAHFVRDQWGMHRTSRRLTREQLIQSAGSLATTAPPIAVLAAAVALADLDQWPEGEVPKPTIDQTTRVHLRTLLASVLRDHDVPADDIADVVRHLDVLAAAPIPA